VGGQFEVFARWTALSNRASNVPYEIAHAGGTTIVYRSQRVSNNTWVSLGTYTFNAGTSGGVTVGTAGTNGYVIVDAVKFSPVGGFRLLDDGEGEDTGTGKTSSITEVNRLYGNGEYQDADTVRVEESVKIVWQPELTDWQDPRAWSIDVSNESVRAADILPASRYQWVGGNSRYGIDEYFIEVHAPGMASDWAPPVKEECEETLRDSTNLLDEVFAEFWTDDSDLTNP
jgi:hypothetical protein